MKKLMSALMVVACMVALPVVARAENWYYGSVSSISGNGMALTYGDWKLEGFSFKVENCCKGKENMDGWIAGDGTFSFRILLGDDAYMDVFGENNAIAEDGKSVANAEFNLYLAFYGARVTSTGWEGNGLARAIYGSAYVRMVMDNWGNISFKLENMSASYGDETEVTDGVPGTWDADPGWAIKSIKVPTVKLYCD